MTDDMLHVMKWHNGDKSFSPFSDAEMARRQNDVRGWMAKNNVDAALFTSYHCINYYSGWLYCYFGRKYGMVIDHDNATTISAGIDGGQPWRRSYGDNVTYTDWRRDNFYQAVRQLTPGAKRIGIEFDHVSLDFRRQLEAALPGVEFIDVGQPSNQALLGAKASATFIPPGVACIDDIGISGMDAIAEIRQIYGFHRDPSRLGLQCRRMHR